MNSVTSPLVLPGPDDSWHDWLAARCSISLDAARDGLRVLKNGAHEDAALEVWNDINIALANVFAVASLLSQVHPDEQIRDEAQQAEREADKLATDLSLDPEAYAALEAVDATALDADAARLLQLTLRDFIRAGVDKDDHTREHLRRVAERETALGQDFSKNIRDDVRVVRLTREELDGLPEDYIEAHPADDDGLHSITTDYPDVYPFLMFASEPDARRRIHVAFLSRAWPANDALLHELLALRAEHASLLGYADWTEFDAEVKMIGSGAAIGDFIERLVAVSDESARRDRDVLLERLRRDDPGATSIDRADATHYAELVRRESFDVDAQQVRRYFDFARVRAGLLDITGRLFGVGYDEVDATAWDSDVAAYDVTLEGEPIGRIYLDLHPRDGKYKHAAQFDLVRGISGRQLPEGVLVCNFPRGLMEHSDVVTLFHEFGHLLHHVLAGRQHWVRFSGVSTEWDFVEAPSQLLEEWAWHADILRTFATDADGEPIPEELVAKTRAAHDFGKGYLMRTQMFYASVSYRLHHEPVGDLTEMVRRLQTTYDLFPYVEGTHFHAAFGHLQDYTSAYYTYMWSLVISKDLLSAFDSDDMLETRTARRYRDTILAPGGSRAAADLVTEFLGRPYDFEAFAGWLAEAPVPAAT